MANEIKKKESEKKELERKVGKTADRNSKGPVAPPKKPSKIKRFFRDVKQEFKATSWPTRKELVASTGVVLFLLAIMAVYFGLIDLGFSNLTRVIVQVLGLGG